MSPNRPAPASIANAKSKQWGHKGRIKRQINMNEWKDKRKTQTKRNTSSNKTTTENTTEKHQPISRFLQRKQSTTHPYGNKSRPQEHPHQRPPPEPPPGTQDTEATGRRVTPWNEISAIVQTAADFQLTNPPRTRPPPKPPPERASAGQNEEQEQQQEQTTLEDAPGSRTNAMGTLYNEIAATGAPQLPTTMPIPPRTPTQCSRNRRTRHSGQGPKHNRRHRRNCARRLGSGNHHPKSADRGGRDCSRETRRKKKKKTQTLCGMGSLAGQSTKLHKGGIHQPAAFVTQQE